MPTFHTYSSIAAWTLPLAGKWASTLQVNWLGFSTQPEAASEASPVILKLVHATVTAVASLSESTILQVQVALRLTCREHLRTAAALATGVTACCLRHRAPWPRLWRQGRRRPGRRAALARAGRAAGPNIFLLWDSSFDWQMVLWALLEAYQATQQVNPIIQSHVTAFSPAGLAGHGAQAAA